jgi:hypothetical protein
MSHYVGFPIERTAFRLMACRQIGHPPVKRPRLAATAVVRLGMRDRKLNTPSQWADFVPLIKPPPFTPRQEDYCGLAWQL